MRRRIHVKGDLESTHRSSGISLLDKVPQHWFFSKKWVAQYIQHIKAWPSIFIFSQKWGAQYIQHIKAIQRAIIRSQPARQCAARTEDMSYEEEDTCRVRRRIHVKGDIESNHQKSACSTMRRTNFQTSGTYNVGTYHRETWFSLAVQRLSLDASNGNMRKARAQVPIRQYRGTLL